MWIYLSGSDGLSQIILYDYQPGRGGRYPQEFLEGFSGMLQCDGYQGYNKVNDVILVCCLAHCRRKFYEAVPAKRRKSWKLFDINSEEAIPEPSIPKDPTDKSLIPAKIGLAYCNKLFFIERELKDLAPEERKAKREEKENTVWEEFWNWLSSLQPAGGSQLEKAVNYAQNHRETLCNYLLDARCEISNNAAERRAKSYAIGRKAFLFHTSAAGDGSLQYGMLFIAYVTSEAYSSVYDECLDRAADEKAESARPELSRATAYPLCMYWTIMTSWAGDYKNNH